MVREIMIEAPDATSAALLMRETVGRMSARLEQRGDSGWRVIVVTNPATRPTMADVVSLILGWLATNAVPELIVCDGPRRFAVRRREEQPGSARSGGRPWVRSSTAAATDGMGAASAPAAA